ncbi:MAG TPA: hypothetical protein VNC41_19075, partial [Acidimicrobiia bacterium]|nr:hypothetical protein [Acidimicrobiia bacterium]
MAVSFAPALEGSAHAAGNDSYDWAQCKNDTSGGDPITGGTTNDNKQDPCQWVNGNLGATNSIYAEGDVVPQRAVRTVAVAGSHSITLDHSFFSGGEYTYDFFATPDYTLKSNLAPCNDVPSTGSFGDFGNAECLALYANKTVLPIPTEASAPTGVNTYTYPHVADAQTDAAADGVTRDLWMSCGYVNNLNNFVAVSCDAQALAILGRGASNGTLLSAANQTAAGVDSFTQLKISFTTPQPNMFIAIWVGGHLAKTSFWNDPARGAYQDLGASHASGSSFHERLIFDETGSTGNRDNQLQAGVVVPSGSLKVMKDDLTNSSTPFPFTANAPLSPTNF